MPQVSQIAALALASAVIIAVPGPSVLFIVGRALAQGRRVAFATVVGNTAGSLLAGVVVAVGLGEILTRSDIALHAVRYAGAAYLVFLGAQALWSHSRRGAVRTPRRPPFPSWWRAALQGLIVGVSNPKVYILYAAILPQFVNVDSGGIVEQMVILAFVPVLIGLVTDVAWALAASAVRGSIARSPLRLRRVGQAGGVGIIALGVITAVTGVAH